jgi:hypothetical protein
MCLRVISTQSSFLHLKLLNILSPNRDRLDEWLNGHSIDLEHLDITDYLSAPNRINICNKHVETVYLIFTDLFDMS